MEILDKKSNRMSRVNVDMFELICQRVGRIYSEFLIFYR